MKENLSDDYRKFQKSKEVLVIGDAILDTYVKGAPDRVSREAPVMVFNVDEQEHQCGGAANTAINVAALGAETYFLTVLGKDLEFTRIDGCSQKKQNTYRFYHSG